MLCNILWQGEPLTAYITGRGPDVEVTAVPVVVDYWFGVTPGLYFSRNDQFGWWYSSNITDIMTAWRVAQLLPHVNRFREHPWYEQTIRSLVMQLGVDDHEERRQDLAADFGVTVGEMTLTLDMAQQLGPTEYELESILERIQRFDRERTLSFHLTSIERAEEAGCIRLTPRSLEIIDEARSCQERQRRQLEKDAREIETPSEPEHSAAQLLRDIGVTDLAHPIGYIDGIGQIYVEMDEFDHLVKEKCIGELAYCNHLPVRTWGKSPDDSSTHHSSEMQTLGSILTVHTSGLEKVGKPVLAFGDVQLVIHHVRYERGGTFWLSVSTRPLPTPLEADDEQDADELSVYGFREKVGELLGLTEALPVEPVAYSELAVVKPTPSRGWRRFLPGKA